MIKARYPLFKKGLAVRVKGDAPELTAESYYIIHSIYNRLKEQDAQDAAIYKNAIIDALTDAEDATDD